MTHWEEFWWLDYCSIGCTIIDGNWRDVYPSQSHQKLKDAVRLCNSSHDVGRGDGACCLDFLPSLGMKLFAGLLGLHLRNEFRNPHWHL